MKRDTILIGIPGLALALVVGAVILLMAQFRAFERSALTMSKEDLLERVQLVSDLVSPELAAGQFEHVQARLEAFRGKPFRVTVINAEGRVMADSDADARQLGNHNTRPEVINAEPGEFVERYSTTMHARLLYTAVKNSDGYVIRASVPMEVIDHAARQLRRSVGAAMAVGAGLVAVLFLYVFLRVRPQFLNLQDAAVAIARGKRNVEVEVPKGGVLRDLSKAIAVMGRQIQNRMDALQKERNAFDLLLNALRDPLLLIAPSGEILFSNRAARYLFGDSVAHKGFRIERTASAELVSYVRSAFEDPVIRGREVPFDDGGTQRSLLAHAVRMERDGVLCLLVLLTDLTDLRRLESFRADFVANVSHEIKTPLTAILSTVETLSEVKLDAASQAHCLEILQRQALRLNNLVQDILSLAAIERRQMAPTADFADVNLTSLVRDAVTLCQDEAERAGIQLQVESDIPQVTVSGDAHLLEQSVVNLISNAIRHASPSTITVNLSLDGNQAKVEVSDDGCGISSADQARLFERFYRVHKDRSRSAGGTGLGLAIVKHAILLHRGTVSVTSALGKGSTFTLTLPAHLN